MSNATLQKAVWSEDPNLPVGQIQSLAEMVAGLQTQPRGRAKLLSVFASLTLLLVAIGIYGVMAQSVAQRYREIGIRMALASDRQKVLLLVLKQGFSLTVAGVSRNGAWSARLPIYEEPPSTASRPAALSHI